MGKKSREDAYRRLEESLIKMNNETIARQDIDQVTKDRIINNNLRALEAARQKLDAE